MRKMVNLFKSQVILAVLAVAVMCLGVIKMTPVMLEALQLAQKMQRLGVPSRYTDLKMAICFAVMITMWVILSKCAMYIGKVIMTTRKKTWNQVPFEEDRNKRILVKFLFEEIEDGCPVPQEEELWALLLDMSAKQLAEALEQLQEQRVKKYCI